MTLSQGPKDETFFPFSLYKGAEPRYYVRDLFFFFFFAAGSHVTRIGAKKNRNFIPINSCYQISVEMIFKTGLGCN